MGKNFIDSVIERLEPTLARYTHLKGIRFRIIASTLVITFTTTVVLGVMFGSANLWSVYDALNSKGNVISSFLAKISPTYIANYDLSALEEFVTELGKADDVALASFLDKNGKVLAVSTKENLNLHKYLEFKQPIFGIDDKSLGEFRIYYKKEALFNRLWFGLLWLFLGLSVALFGVAVGVNGIASQVTTILNSVSLHLTHSASELSASGQNINSVSSKLTLSSSEATTSLNSTLSSMQQMNAMILQTAQNSVKGVSRAEESQRDTVEGQKVVKAFENAMIEIAAANKKVESIRNVINLIKEKTKVIDDIVFQTKLLSFNASIEAARAGEHGKGFAVVADEIGKLARDSGKAADEIGDLLDQSTVQVAATIQETVSKIFIGQKASVECAGVFKKIGTNIQNMTVIANEISAACKEQERGVDRTRSEMNVLAEITDKNSQLAQRASEIAVYLQEQAQALDHNVSTLETAIGSNGELPKAS